MAFALERTKEFKEECKKAVKKNNELKKAIESKIQQIIDDPCRFKPMCAPLQGFRRVHIMKSFVLLYTIKENTVLLVKFGHHDNAYK